MRANAKVAKQNGYTGIPNGDMGGVPTSDKAYSNDQLDPETDYLKMMLSHKTQNNSTGYLVSLYYNSSSSKSSSGTEQT